MKSAFANNLRHLMHSHQLSHEQMAHKAGVSRPSITQYLGKKKRPSSRTLLKLARIFKVDPEALLIGDVTGQLTAETPAVKPQPQTKLRPCSLETSLQILPESGLRCLVGWMLRAAEERPQIREALTAFIECPDIAAAGLLVARHQGPCPDTGVLTALGKLAAENWNRPL